MKLLITGGHLTPALSLIDYAKAKGDEIVFIGRQYSSRDHRLESHEKAEIENRGGTFISFDTIKIHRHQKLKSFLMLPKLIPAVTKALEHLRTHRPDVVISFGGYIALPIAIAAKIIRIPLFTHEQTHVIGLANQIIIRFADVVGISWAKTQGYLPAHKTTVTGNPLRFELKQPSQAPSWVTSNKPIIYITGGSQGARAINQVITQIISQLSQKYYCIHQTGNQADFETASQLKITLPEDQKHNFTVSTWYQAKEVSWILDKAVAVVSRSGANTITELIYKNTPAVLIPLPTAGSNEQYQNAKAIADQKGAIMIPQSKLTPDLLLTSLEDLIQNQTRYRQNLEHIAKNLKTNPEETIYQIVKSLHENQHSKTSKST